MNFFYHWIVLFWSNFYCRYLKIIQIEIAIKIILIANQTLQTCPFRIESLKVKGWGEGVRTLIHIYIYIHIIIYIYIYISFWLTLYYAKVFENLMQFKKGYSKKKTKFSDDHINMRPYKTPTYLRSTCLKTKQ